MKINDAINLKGTMVTANRGEPKYSGKLLYLTKINRTWFGRIQCQDGEDRCYRVKWLKVVKN